MLVGALHNQPGPPQAKYRNIAATRVRAHAAPVAGWEDSVHLDQMPGTWQPSWPGTPRDIAEKEAVRCAIKWAWHSRGALEACACSHKRGYLRPASAQAKACSTSREERRE